MTFLEALYGSQYREISERGKDGSKGRLNGNIFLAAFIVLMILASISVIITISSAINTELTHALKNIFGSMSGRSIGKILAIPLMAVCYLAVANTVGTIDNFNKTIESFNNLPESEKDKANKKILTPFFIALGVLVISSII